MNNLIITVIAIALICVISLIGIFYSGSMISGNQFGAAAPAVIDLGQEIAGAFDNYLSDNQHNSPGSWANLVGSGYLPSLPMVPPMPGAKLNLSASVLDISTQNQGGIYEDTSNVWFYVADVGRPTSAANYASDQNGQVCEKILEAALSSSPGSAPTIASVTGITDATFNNTQLDASNNPIITGNTTYGCFYWAGGANGYKGGLTDDPTFPASNGGDYVFFYRLGN